MQTTVLLNVPINVNIIKYLLQNWFKFNRQMRHKVEFKPGLLVFSSQPCHQSKSNNLVESTSPAHRIARVSKYSAYSE